VRRFFLFGTLLLSLQGQDAAKLEHARKVNLERAAKLPSFVMDEKATRYKSRHTDPPKWEVFDTIESEIAVRGEGFTRENVRRNGNPWKKPNFDNFRWGIPFANEIKPLFDSKCSTAIEFEGRENAQGKQLLAYRFHSPPNGCFGNFLVRKGFLVVSASKTNNPARTGRILIDDPGGNVIRYQEEASEFPKGFGLDPWKQTTTWDYVTIGDASHLLPVAEDIYGGFTFADLWHVVVEYKNHRHFEASTNITFK
jgi:hypothetical protein